jgi:predicted transcriptional regulator
METYVVDHNLPNLPLHMKYRMSYFPLGKKYRSHFEIIALMVEAVKDGGQARFSILKHASINCGQLNKFLASLVEMGFIEQYVANDKILYRASERGLAFLRQYYALLSTFLAPENGAKRPPFMYEPELRRG